jgi:hypothetical protein
MRPRASDARQTRSLTTGAAVTAGTAGWLRRTGSQAQACTRYPAGARQTRSAPRAIGSAGSHGSAGVPHAPGARHPPVKTPGSARTSSAASSLALGLK